MNDMKSFRNISDRIMKDLVVTPELKSKTLEKCKTKSYKPVIGVLVPAACVVLIVAVMAAAGRFPWNGNTVPEKSSEITVLLEAAQGGESRQQDNSGDALKAAQEEQLQVVYKSPEEARKDFGDSLLIPGYIPEGFILNSIEGTVKGGQKADRVVLNYSSGEVSFVITEERNSVGYEFPDFKAVDINGITGYVKTDRSKTEGQTGQQHTELHWTGNESRYSVVGQISEELAINIARSMK